MSVVTPLYNSAPYIAETLASLQRQTCDDWECILVDDGSTDDTELRVKPFLADSRFRYLEQEHRGIAAARNRAIQAAQGRWIALLDHDDRWLPAKLERQLAFAETHELDIVCSDATVVTSDARFPFSDWLAEEVRRDLERSPSDDVDTFALLIRVNFLCASSVVARRSLFEQRGLLDPAVAAADDYDMWLRCMPEARIGYIPEPLIEYVLHSGNYSAHTLRMHEQAIDVLLRALRRHSRDRERVRQFEASLALQYRLTFEELRRRGDYGAALRHAARLLGRGLVGARILTASLRGGAQA